MPTGLFVAYSAELIFIAAPLPAPEVVDEEWTP